MLILLIEDEQRIREGISQMLVEEGYDVLEAASLAQAKQQLEESPAIVLSDINLPDGDAFMLLSYCHACGMDASFIFMTAFGSRDLAIKAFAQGAADYISKPLRFDELFARLHRIKEMQSLRGQVQRKALRKLAVSSLATLGASKAMQSVKTMAEKAAGCDVPLLITGETGVGKGLLAKLIHASSPRNEKAFISVNCASIPETLLESELFGYRKGAFTGADQNKKGLLEEASDGVLFLDEIGEMPLLLQAKLLHVLDDGAFRPLGSTKSLQFKGRIITATNVLPQDLAQGSAFRTDLYYRISVISIDIPPLRDRPEDVLPLAERMYQELAADMGKQVQALPSLLVMQLQQQSWPGNVRQLRNHLERALIFDDETVPVNKPSLHESLQYFEQALIKRTLEECKGNKEAAAQQLGLALSTLYRKLDGK